MHSSARIFGTLLFILYIALNNICIAQSASLDSLKTQLSLATHDTTRVNLLLKMAEVTYMSDPLTTISYCERAREIAEKAKYLRGMSQAYGWLGYLYDQQGRIEKALEYNHKSLKILEKLNDTESLGSAYNNIGGILFNQGQFDEALIYFTKGLEALEKTQPSPGMGGTLCNIGNIYYQKGDLVQASDYYRQSLEAHTTSGDQQGVAYDYMWLGLVAKDEGNFETAIENVEKCTKTLKELKDLEGLAYSENIISDIYLKQRKLDAAKSHALQSMVYSRELGSPESIGSAANRLSIIYEAQGNGMQALSMYKLYREMDDSLNNLQVQRATIQTQMRYEFDKKAMADSLAHAKESEILEIESARQRAEIGRKNAELTADRNIRYALFSGLALVLVFAIFMVNRFRITHRQKKIIETKEQETQKQNDTITLQKLMVEEKNKEITDSINYAKRIQAAVLPSRKRVSDLLPDSFIYYQPKDIVSGDFYWLEKLNNRILFAAADCTGHGVPGAMVSVICNNGLNRSVREHLLSEPSQILTKTREIVLQEFEKSEEAVHDGMDISLVSIPTPDAKAEKQIIEWAGANNPIWVIKKDAAEIFEIVADKQPIGKYTSFRPFHNHRLELERGDQIYVFTDGYQDQFGGAHGKKFKSSAMKSVLFANRHKSMPEQKDELAKVFEAWKGNLDQIDDVCVIGVRI